MALNNTLDKTDLTDKNRISHPKASEYMFLKKKKEYMFLSIQQTFSRIDHLLCHRINLNKFKKTELISSISDDNGRKLEINYKKITKKLTNMCRVNNMLLNNQ